MIGSARYPRSLRAKLQGLPLRHVGSVTLAEAWVVSEVALCFTSLIGKVRARLACRTGAGRFGGSSFSMSLWRLSASACR